MVGTVHVFRHSRMHEDHIRLPIAEDVVALPLHLLFGFAHHLLAYVEMLERDRGQCAAVEQALQALRDHGGLRPGHKVLINDGAIRMLAVERDAAAGELRCRVVVGDVLGLIKRSRAAFDVILLDPRTVLPEQDGALLVGPPGTGKTLLIRTLLSRLHATGLPYT